MSAADDHHRWMRRALALATAASDVGEVPVGAVLVSAGGEVLAEASNAPIAEHDPTAHAEILALRRAATAAGNYRLPDTTLYVTIEPCMMCAGALVHARVARLVFGAREPKAGAVASTAQLLAGGHLNHRVDVVEGVLAEEAAALMRQFFESRRRRA